MPLPVFNAAIAAVRAGTGDCCVLFIGDSTTAGVGGTLGGAGGTFQTYCYRTSWPAKMGALVESPSLPVSSAAPAIAASASQNLEWAVGGGWTIVSTGFCTGYQANSSGDITYTPQASSDTYDIYYLVYPGLGTLTAQATGGAPVVIDTSGEYRVGKTTISAGSAATNNTVTVSWTSGSVFYYGAFPRLSATKQLLLNNVGAGGTRSSAWASDPMTKAQIAVQAHLTVIMLGINDSGDTDAATVKANIAAIATIAKLSGDVAFLSIVPSSGELHANQLTYLAMGQELADEFDGIFIDIWTEFGGEFNAPLMNDGLHPNNTGYDLMAAVVKAALFPPAPSGNGGGGLSALSGLSGLSAICG